MLLAYAHDQQQRAKQLFSYAEASKGNAELRALHHHQLSGTVRALLPDLAILAVPSAPTTPATSAMPAVRPVQPPSYPTFARGAVPAEPGDVTPGSNPWPPETRDVGNRD